jgi:hypothetical protein
MRAQPHPASRNQEICGVATYEDAYKLTYVRGPSGILVMLAEELNKS